MQIDAVQSACVDIVFVGCCCLRSRSKQGIEVYVPYTRFSKVSGKDYRIHA